MLNYCLKAERPINPAYPTELNTLGDHLRRVRLDRGMSQSYVARMLNVSTDAVTNWELNRCKPTAKLAKSIIEFLGYFPFSVDDLSLGKQLYYARLITGKTQKQVADLIGCDASNLRYIEVDQRKPQTRIREKIQDYINAALAVL